MDTPPRDPSSRLLSAEEANDRLREIAEGFFFRRLRWKADLESMLQCSLPTCANVARSKARQHSQAHGHLGFAIVSTTRWLPLSSDRSHRYCHRCQHDGARQVCPVAIADEGHHRSQ